MGKYTTLASSFAAKPEAIGFQDRVDKAKTEIHATTQIELANRLIAIREEKQDAKEILSEVNVRLSAVEQMLIDAFEEGGVTSLKLESGASVSTQIRPWVRVEDRRAFHLWCLDNGFADALALPWQTTNSLVSERLIDGLPEPEGITTYKQTSVVVRKN